MCNEKYLTNRPIYKLDKENDLLGNLEKVNFITSFLIENKDYIRKNNMLVLFGNWGSGKTTLIYAIKENVEKDKYLPIIFDAWKYAI